MKKILFFLPNLNGGGAERVTVNIIRQLDKDTFDIFLVLVDDIGVYRPLIPEYVTVYTLGVSKTIFSPWKLRRYIKAIEPEVVFSTLFRTHIVLYVALLGRQKPIVILRSPNSPKLLLESNKIDKITMFFLKKAYAWADVVLAQTPEMKEEVVRYHHVIESKIKVFINPIDTQLIDKNIKNIDTPFDSEKINIVAAGRLTEQKGFDILISAFCRVVEKNNRFVLHIIGKDGGKETQLRQMVKRFRLEKNVFFLGFQENPYKFFFFSDAYVLSSLWEGLPNTVLENLYLQKPIIATKCIPFMEDLLQDGENGLLVEVSNSKLLADAILNYESIKVSESSVLKKKGDINEFFLQEVLEKL